MIKKLLLDELEIGAELSPARAIRIMAERVNELIATHNEHPGRRRMYECDYCSGSVVYLEVPVSKDRRESKKVRFYSASTDGTTNHFGEDDPLLHGFFKLDSCLRFGFCQECHRLVLRDAEVKS